MQDVEIDGEIWKDVVGYEGLYQVSNLGHILSLQRVQTMSNMVQRTIKQRVLKPTPSEKGYLTVHLVSQDGSRKRLKIHRLVAQAFCENPLDLDIVNHIDNDRTNNQSENLEWVTQKDNVEHCIKHNRHKTQNQWGENNSSAKLSIKIVLQIRKLHNQGKSCAVISDLTSVSSKRVSSVIRKESWNFPEAFPESDLN